MYHQVAKGLDNFAMNWKVNKNCKDNMIVYAI